MATDTYISLDALKGIASSLQSQKDQISQSFNGDILPAIKASADCFKVSGLNLNEIVSSFSTTFNNVNSNLNDLINILNNTVIKNYSDTADAIRQNFNVTFANQLRSILNLTK